MGAAATHFPSVLTATSSNAGLPGNRTLEASERCSSTLSRTTMAMVSPSLLTAMNRTPSFGNGRGLSHNGVPDSLTSFCRQAPSIPAANNPIGCPANETHVAGDGVHLVSDPSRGL